MPLLKKVRQNKEGRLIGITEKGEAVNLSTPTPRVISRSTEGQISETCESPWNVPALRRVLKKTAREDNSKFYHLGRGQYDHNLRGGEQVILPYNIYQKIDFIENPVVGEID